MLPPRDLPSVDTHAIPLIVMVGGTRYELSVTEGLALANNITSQLECMMRYRYGR